MKDWYDKGIGSEKMKRDIAKSAKDNPVKFPCLDPEGCKHFKAEQRLQAENDNLKEAINNVPTHEFYEAQRDGLDANAAWDCFSEALSKWLKQALESIPEHISELKAEKADLKRKIKQIHDIVSGSLSDSKTVSMIYEITKA